MLTADGESARFECARDVMADAHGKISHRTLPPSHVRDGVCDCCDGSDEQATAPLVSAPSASTPHAATATASCTDTCAALEAAAAAAQSLRTRGLAARDAMAERAGLAPHPSYAARDAPHAAFRALDGKCFRSEHSREYTYEVCLFTKASQSEKGRGHRPSVSLGHNWQWRYHSASASGRALARLFSSTAAASDGRPMEGVLSAGQRCAGAGVDRSTIVKFVCSAEGEELGQVSERSTCVYEVELHTPAACS